MTRTTPLLPLFGCVLALVACTSPDTTHDGTAVGNPGVVAFALGEPDDIAVELAEGGAAGIGVSACGSDQREGVTWEGPWIPLDGDIVLELPLGTWCTVHLDGLEVFVAGAHVDSQAEDEGLFEVSLALGDVQIHAPGWDGFAVAADDAFVLELGGPGWLGPDAIGLTAGNEVLVEEQDALHDAVAAALVEPSALYRDPDTDGLLSEAERDAGSTAASANPVPSEPQPATGLTGTGCTMMPRPADPEWLALFVGAALGLRRRR